MSGREIKAIHKSINMKGTGTNIKRLMTENGFTIDELMQITGISTRQAIYKWFRGESIPSIEVLLVLSEIFEMNVNELLVLDEESVKYDFDRCDTLVVKEEIIEWMAQMYKAA